jgi:hypothetical protein
MAVPARRGHVEGRVAVEEAGWQQRTAMRPRSQAAAEQAITSSINAFRRAADAHDILAAAYERLAAAGGDDAQLQQQQAARHWAAATADRQRAERAQSILSTE